MLVEGENDFARQSGSDLCPLRSSHYRGFRPDYTAGRQRMVYPLWIYVAYPTGNRCKIVPHFDAQELRHYMHQVKIPAASGGALEGRSLLCWGNLSPKPPNKDAIPPRRKQWGILASFRDSSQSPRQGEAAHRSRHRPPPPVSPPAPFAAAPR